jgi:hypothetical protein
MRLELIEAELKRKLEEIERRKKMIKALEEEEKEILDEISKLGGFQRGTLVAKWVKCGKNCQKCPHGPYYHLVWKEGGKVRWKYIGKELDEKFKNLPKVKALEKRLREIQREKYRLSQLDF